LSVRTHRVGERHGRVAEQPSVADDANRAGALGDEEAAVEATAASVGNVKPPMALARAGTPSRSAGTFAPVAACALPEDCAAPAFTIAVCATTLTAMGDERGLSSKLPSLTNAVSSSVWLPSVRGGSFALHGNLAAAAEEPQATLVASVRAPST
jgi:hypothetical protein